MDAITLAKAYDPKEFEDRLYEFWTQQNFFAPAGDDSKDPFTIVIPPPNVTGVLHMGHGLNNSLQDVLIRYHRMKGRPTLWVPGTDHAGIATQNVVEKRLRAKGIDKHDLGREKFVEETWKVKHEHHTIITKQLKKLGSSCDWSRERFTLDEGLSKAVREVFVNLYEKKLVYKGMYLVNWCTSCGTALADDEVEHQEKQGKIYNYKYPFVDESLGHIEIATTRPETMLGDTAVAVNPEDDRYKHLVGKMLKLPLTDREIPIIADKYVDMEFGTGCVKITPAHDPNDWEIGERHNLEKISILNPNGTLANTVPEKYRGMKVQEARKAVIKDLKDQGYYINDEEHGHQVGHCYRCDTVIEPYMSEQWFVKMKPLAEKALGAWERGEVKFYPKKWENTYTHWLNGIRDWCISRQLWWGHRIPVWYCGDCGEMMVLREDPSNCAKCNSENIRQDNDVLDTWFSSWLWPFSTLGWPEKTPDLEKFYPTTALVTAYDIIFFWVARMIMAGMEFMGKPPFKDIYIHQLVRDKTGRKMSKSLGNGIDPLEIIDEFGADALKFTLSFLAAQGQDILIDKETFKLGSKFANKVWNASRYILMNLKGRNILPKEEIKHNDIDKWILHRLNEAVKAIDVAMEAYKFNDAAHEVYEFFWNDFCDWYIEASKLSLYSKDDAEKDRAISMLIAVLEESLKVMHPFLSYLTEEIYMKLPGENRSSIMIQQYSEYTEERKNDEINENFSSLQEIVRQVRTLRSEFTLPPDKKIKVAVQVEGSFKGKEFFQNQKDLIADLIKASELEITEGDVNKDGSIATVGKGYEAHVFIKDVIDVPKEIAKLKKNLEKAEKLKNQTERKLSNQKFLANAPDDVVAKEKSKLDEFTRTIEKTSQYLKELE